MARTSFLSPAIQRAVAIDAGTSLLASSDAVEEFVRTVPVAGGGDPAGSGASPTPVLLDWQALEQAIPLSASAEPASVEDWQPYIALMKRAAVGRQPWLARERNG